MNTIDFSSIVHRMIHRSIKTTEPKKINGMYKTSDFIGLVKYYIFSELFQIMRDYSKEFGDMVICIDESSGGYWRHDVYSEYKNNRTKLKDVSDIDYKEVFKHINEMIAQIDNNLPWKVVSVPRAEADDIILVLASEISETEKFLIYSPDKDMIQAHRNSNVFQYSALTEKWIQHDDKSESMEEWIQEHVCLGDASDGVPRVIDGTEFSNNFLLYLEDNDVKKVKTPLDWKKLQNLKNEKVNRVLSDLLENYAIYKFNRKGEPTEEKDIYVKKSFGPATLKKTITKFGSLDNWLDSNPMYRENYERNRTLILEEGIPDYIRYNILSTFKNAKMDYNQNEFREYLNANNLKSLALEIPKEFRGISGKTKLTMDDFNW